MFIPHLEKQTFWNIYLHNNITLKMKKKWFVSYFNVTTLTDSPFCDTELFSSFYDDILYIFNTCVYVGNTETCAAKSFMWKL